MSTETTRTDVYTRVTDKIIADLEAGVRTWHKPWSVEDAVGRIIRPLRGNGKPYQGVNVLFLWAEAIEHGYGSARGPCRVHRQLVEVLKQDKRFIFTAASHATRAVDFLHSLQAKSAEPDNLEDAA